jgi:hypothetical protein
VGSKIYGINHGAPNDTRSIAKVDCWDKATLTSCAPFSSPSLKDASGNVLHTGFSVDAAVRAGKLYYTASRKNANSYEIGVACFDTANFANASTNFCGFTPWQTSTASGATGLVGLAPGAVTRGYGYFSGLIEQPGTDNVWAVVASGTAKNGAGTEWQNLSLVCRSIAGVLCGDTDLGRWHTGSAPLISYLSFDPQSNRLWVALDRGTMTCRQLANPTVKCAGFNNSANITMPTSTIFSVFATPTGVCVTYNSTFNCYKVDGTSDGVMSGLLRGSPVVFTNVVGVQLVVGNKWYFPMSNFNGSAHTTDGAVCVDSSTMAYCAGFGANGKRTNSAVYLNYGFAPDPADPTCFFGLGDKGIPFKFNGETGGNGCGNGSSVTVEPGLNYCDNKNHSITWDKATFSPSTTGFTQIKVKNSTTNAVVATIPVTAALSYDLSSVGYGANPKLTLEFVSSGSTASSPTVNVSWKADVDAQICMAFTMTACPPAGASVVNKAATAGNQAVPSANVTSELSCGAITTTSTTTLSTTSTTIKGASSTIPPTIAPTLPPPPVSATVPPTFAPPQSTSPVQIDKNPDLPFVIVSGNELPFTQ